MRTFISPAKRLPILLLAMFLAGCYLPSQFKVDVRIGNNGSYSVSYVGRLAETSLLAGLTDGTMGAAKEAERVEAVKKDLARDSGFRVVEYIGKGFFEVKYQKSGNIFTDKTLTFVNGNSQIISIAYVEETNTLTVRGGSVPVNFRDRLKKLGFVPEGEMRIVTDAIVLEHNAEQVSGGEREKTYSWTLRSLDAPTPKIVIGGG